MSDDLQKGSYFYELPKELIAQTPIADRAASRLMVLDKHTGDVRHAAFRNILSFLNPGDCLVINDTKVLPARLVGHRSTGGAVEVLLLRRLEGDVWEALVKPGRNARNGEIISFGEGTLSCVVEDDSLEDGKRLVRFSYDGIFEEVLANIGEMPLPPYITEKLSEKDRYQTVYAANEGSVAAPTAGLHFTPELLQEIESAGVRIVRITLHVGLGTFRPVKADNVKDHVMHEEFCIVSEKAAGTINGCKSAGGRVVCVGTTSCRTLETMCDDTGFVRSGSMWTGIFIYPGYKFKVMDGLITNFHLPESTLLMLVSAFAGRENILAAYNQAVDHKYRFFSFGDAMLIL
ncbi:MAG: tRNA preQ1(34) S-adenosylmethionine ribosyltransferase-isomerase QueA [Defluviitaleaceae bacterium]|nr:tRNA preQ1(34) S-adenosylmethionine ribosyltransferase-isomerase QueA [Defluviitaleaceae bacterium]